MDALKKVAAYAGVVVAWFFLHSLIFVPIMKTMGGAVFSVGTFAVLADFAILIFAIVTVSRAFKKVSAKSE